MDERKRRERDFIYAAMKKTGLTSSALARCSGLEESTLNRPLAGWESGEYKHNLSKKTIRAVAKFSGVAPPKGLDAMDAEIPLGPRLTIPANGPENLPILGRAMGGKGEAMDLNGPAIGYTSCPAQLKDVADAYAVYMTGESMEPKYEAGQLLYVHPHRPARAGNFVVTELTDGRAFVKQFIKRDNDAVVVRQLNPDKRITYHLPEVKAIHRIVAADEVL